MQFNHNIFIKFTYYTPEYAICACFPKNKHTVSA